jgi:hypothetical protein
MKKPAYVSLIITVSVLFSACSGQKTEYTTFADYPGFKEYFKSTCTRAQDSPPASEEEKALLQRFRPRIILPSGGRFPVDFYRDYLPFTVLRSFPDRKVVVEHVTPEILKKVQHNKGFYLDFQRDKFQKAGLDKSLPDGEKESVLYGRVYRERIPFPCGNGETCLRDFMFLKYNLVFAISGLPSTLPAGYRFLLRLSGLDPEDWHELDNFVAVHIVLNEAKNPIAVLLAQHDYHRTYLIGKDILLPPDGKIAFNIAIQSNEIYPASLAKDPAEHRVIKEIYHLKYLLSGEDPPLVRGHDVIQGIHAGGEEIRYTLKYLSPCDPFYTSTIVLGELRPFLGKYIGRDGPNGADYYTMPSLLPLGKLLQFSYLQNDDPDDIEMAGQAIDADQKKIDISSIMKHGGTKFYRDLQKIER